MRLTGFVKRCAGAALSALALGLCGGCTIVVLQGDGCGPEGGEVGVNLHFRCGSAGGTKSAMYSGDGMKDINLYVWQNGTCVMHEFVEDAPDGMTLSLTKGTACSFYAVANCGGRVEPEAEDWRNDESSMRSLSVGLPDVSERHFLPMAGSVSGIVLSRPDTELTLVLERLVSRIVISFTPDVALNGSGIKITGIRLCDAAQTVSPFTERCRADGGATASGDWSSDEDLEKVNAGREIDFYAFENCWGDLLPDNTDQKKKVPSEFGDIKGPTYIELNCEFADNVLLSGGLTYRIYLGSDATGNFDIVRNSSYRILLGGSRDGLDEVSWRIDKDFTYNDYLASFELVRSRHDADDLYVGEVIRAKVCGIDPSVTAFFGGSAEQMLGSCMLRCIADDGDEDAVDEDPVAFTFAGVAEDGGLEVEGVCRAAIPSGSLWLCRSDGRLVTKIGEGVSVSVPNVVLSAASSAHRPGNVSTAPKSLINGTSGSVFAYLCDSDGVNLLSGDGAGYGFSSEVFSLSAICDSSKWKYASARSCFKSSLSDFYDGDSDGLAGQPFCKVSLAVSNAGTYASVNDELWDAVATAGAVTAGLKDSIHGFSGSTAFNIGYLPFEVGIYDSAYGGEEIVSEYGFSAASEPVFMMVRNPSKLSFKFRYMALTKRGTKVLSSKATEQAGASLCFYNCPDSLTLPATMYLHYAEADIRSTVSSTSVSCKVTNLGGDLIRIGMSMGLQALIAAAGTSETVLSNNRYGYYDSSVSTSATNRFNITGGICVMSDFATGKDGRLSYSFSDNMEDGSSECDYVYTNDYSPLSVRFYSADSYLGYSGVSSHSYSSYADVRPRKLSRLMGNVRKVTIGMNNSDTADPHFTMMTDGVISSSYARASLTCSGFCSTHANGTKRNTVDYSLTKSRNASIYYFGSRSASVKYSFTNSTIADLFADIFNTTYTDSHNWYGNKNNWQHHAHPTGLTMDVTFTEYGNYSYVYDFAAWSGVNLTYTNSGYSSVDSPPYTVPASIDWKQIQSRFKNKMILLR